MQKREWVLPSERSQSEKSPHYMIPTDGHSGRSKKTVKRSVVTRGYVCVRVTGMAGREMMSQTAQRIFRAVKTLLYYNDGSVSPYICPNP